MQFGPFNPLRAFLRTAERPQSPVKKARVRRKPGPRGAKIYHFRCQMRSLYSLMVRSLEKMPLQAVLVTVMRSHFSLS